MLLINSLIRDYSDFQYLFTTIAANGQRVRKNKVLLATYKHYMRNGRVGALIRSKDDTIRGLSELVSFARWELRALSFSCKFSINLDGYRWGSNSYYLDENDGATFNDDTGRMVSVIDDKTGKKVVLNIGRLLRMCAIDMMAADTLGESLTNYVIEEQTKKYISERAASEYDLKLDDDFEYIYNSYNHINGAGFGSCMVNDGYHTFYSNCCDAQAAALIHRPTGKMAARCIVWSSAKSEETGKVYRLAERQYSAESSVVLMQMLVSKLYAAQKIDGHRPASGGRTFVDVDGKVIGGILSVPCNIDYDEYVSYQDSFYLYDYQAKRAYNGRLNGSQNFLELDTTGGRLEGLNYDEYNDEYTTDSLILVNIYNSVTKDYRQYYVSEDYARECDDWFMYRYEYYDDGVYSELLDEMVPHTLIKEAEDRWRRNNMVECWLTGKRFLPSDASHMVILNTNYSGQFCYCIRVVSTEAAERSLVKIGGLYFTKELAGTINDGTFNVGYLADSSYDARVNIIQAFTDAGVLGKAFSDATAAVL